MQQQPDDGDRVDRYRGQTFLIETRRDGPLWTGHYRLVGPSDAQAGEAAIRARHQWVPPDRGWVNETEARTNATEAAHAAIDALLASTPASGG
jgi:hypothetical protein